MRLPISDGDFVERGFLFLIQKVYSSVRKLKAKLHELYPKIGFRFIRMVKTFSEIPYLEA